MKIGIIFTAFNVEQYVDNSLDPWLSARNGTLDGHEFLIAAISVPFKGFNVKELDNTQIILKEYYNHQDIDYLHSEYDLTRTFSETDARGLALKWLMEKKVDILIQWDGDEIASLENISKIVKCVEDNPYITMFRLSYKNLVFTENQYLEEPFTPARIHRTCVGGFVASGFWDDNNVFYTYGDRHMRDSDMASKIIPRSIAWPRHYTWLNDFRSKQKIQYQMSRGWPSCSFRWDEKEGLKFNEEHFRRLGQPLPKVISE